MKVVSFEFLAPVTLEWHEQFYVALALVDDSGDVVHSYSEVLAGSSEMVAGVSWPLE
jgi:hypothetical protein